MSEFQSAVFISSMSKSIHYSSMYIYSCDEPTEPTHQIRSIEHTPWTSCLHLSRLRSDLHSTLGRIRLATSNLQLSLVTSGSASCHIACGQTDGPHFFECSLLIAVMRGTSNLSRALDCVKEHQQRRWVQFCALSRERAKEEETDQTLFFMGVQDLQEPTTRQAS